MGYVRRRDNQLVVDDDFNVADLDVRLVSRALWVCSEVSETTSARPDNRAALLERLDCRLAAA